MKQSRSRPCVSKVISLVSVVVIVVGGCGRPVTATEGSATAAASVECADALSAPVSFRISHLNSTASPIHPHLESIVNSVATATSNKIRMNIFPDAQLGGPADGIEQATFGENVIVYTTAGGLAGLGVADLTILDGLFLTPTLESAQSLAESEVMQNWIDELAAKGVRVLAINWFDSPRSMLGQRGYPHPNDLRGVTVRIPEVRSFRETFRQLGASTQAIPFSELYFALEQGVVEATEGGIRGMADANLMEVARTVTITDHFRLFCAFVMSEERFSQLPASCRVLLESEFRAKGDAYSQQMEQITSSTIAALANQGISFVTADKEAYRVATRGYYDAFPEWTPGLYDRVMTALSR